MSVYYTVVIRILDPYKERSFKLGELASVAANLTDQLSLRTPDRRVGPITVRTIRYYQSMGLVDPPELPSKYPPGSGSRGREGLYSFHHLLQVLVVRRCQVEGAKLETIKDAIDMDMLSWNDTEALEKALELDLEMLREEPYPPAVAEAHLRRVATKAGLFSWSGLMGGESECRLSSADARAVMEHEIIPGVRVTIDPSRVKDPDEVLKRIANAVKH